MQFHIIESEAGRSVSAVINGTLRVANGDHPNFDAIVTGLVAGEDVSDLFDASEAVSERFRALSDRVSVRSGVIYLDGEPQDNTLTSQVVRFLRAGEDFGPLVKFYDKVQTNPNEHSREQLFDWLRDRDFSITRDGDFIAYKGLTSDLGSIHRGPGIVDGVQMNGSLPNNPGSVIEVARGYVASDSGVGCSTGLHAGTWDYASSFGQRVVEVRINPRDVVSVPTDCSAQKLRTCRYTVIQEVTAADHSPLRSFEDDDVDYGEDDWSEDEDNLLIDEHSVPSDSNPGTYYTVEEYEDGTLVCECPSYRYSTDNECKHTRQVW